MVVIDFLGHTSIQNKLYHNRMYEVLWLAASKGNEAKDETTFRYAHVGIWTQVVVICGPACYR